MAAGVPRFRVVAREQPASRIRYETGSSTSPGTPLSAYPTPMHPFTSSTEAKTSSIESAPSREEIRYALVHGLMTCDPRMPCVALATVRALRRSEQSHVDRVAASVDAVLAKWRPRESSSADPLALQFVADVLDDLAPFEREAARRLLGTRGVSCEMVDEHVEPPAAACPPAPLATRSAATEPDRDRATASPRQHAPLEARRHRHRSRVRR